MLPYRWQKNISYTGLVMNDMKSSIYDENLSIEH